MDREGRKELYWFWTLVSVIATALFWGIWRLAVGSVPVLNQIQFSELRIFRLPISISRWWDVVTVPIWAIMIVWLATKDWLRENKALFLEIRRGLIFGSITGLTFQLVGLLFVFGFDLDFGFDLSLFFGFYFALIGSLIVGLLHGLYYDKFLVEFPDDWIAFSSIGFSFSLFLSLFGLTVGLMIGFYSVLIFTLATGAGILVKYLFRLFCLIGLVANSIFKTNFLSKKKE